MKDLFFLLLILLCMIGGFSSVKEKSGFVIQIVNSVNKKIVVSFLLLSLSFFYVVYANAQSKFSITPGIFYNGTGFTENVKGAGVILGLEYMQREEHFFSIEFRTKYGYYKFDDGTNWEVSSEGVVKPPKNPTEARLEYSLFSPQLSLVPKFHLHLDDLFSLFLENEFSAGLMTGSFRYKGVDKKVAITESLFTYHIGIGAEYKFNKHSIVGSVSYSTLNFRSKIKKHSPVAYTETVPNQHAGLLVNIIWKIPL